MRLPKGSEYNVLAMLARREDVGLAIKALRERRALVQVDLAKRCRLSRGAIGQFERGIVSPSLETLGRILEALDSDLVGLQRELDRLAGMPPADSDQVVEIAGVRLGTDEVERRLEEAFDRLVWRSIESARKAVTPASSAGVRVN